LIAVPNRTVAGDHGTADTTDTDTDAVSAAIVAKEDIILGLSKNKLEVSYLNTLKSTQT
jgi:hypothetical protein